MVTTRKGRNGDDIEERKIVEDIQIVVYSDDEMKKERKYEEEYGWKEEWITQGICFLHEQPENTQATAKIYDEYKKFEKFKSKWDHLKGKNKVPGWYHFDPVNPKQPADDHNLMKAWDEQMFDFLKEEKWYERTAEKDYQGRIQYEEKAKFVVDCSKLLGIGGEAIVIRSSLAKTVGRTPENRQDVALKIIPIMTHNFEDKDKVKEMQDRVDARHKQADPANFFRSDRYRTDIGQRYFNLFT